MISSKNWEGEAVSSHLLLMGEESYYIDLIADYITINVLNETEKEFNLVIS